MGKKPAPIHCELHHMLGILMLIITIIGAIDVVAHIYGQGIDNGQETEKANIN
jgi:hypothetical protein